MELDPNLHSQIKNKKIYFGMEIVLLFVSTTICCTGLGCYGTIIYIGIKKDGRTNLLCASRVPHSSG